MTHINFIKLVLLNAVSAAIHTDTHFGATKSWKQHINRICEIQRIGPSNIFLIFFISVKIGPKRNCVLPHHLMSLFIALIMAVMLINQVVREIVKLLNKPTE